MNFIVSFNVMFHVRQSSGYVYIWCLLTSWNLSFLKTKLRFKELKKISSKVLLSRCSCCGAWWVGLEINSLFSPRYPALPPLTFSSYILVCSCCSAWWVGLGFSPRYPPTFSSYILGWRENEEIQVIFISDKIYWVEMVESAIYRNIGFIISWHDLSFGYPRPLHI